MRRSFGEGISETDQAWDRLISNLMSGECVPFLGSGACAEYVPLAAPMARAWGKRAGYPLYGERSNLPRVMQYIATILYDGDATSLKRDFIHEELASVMPPNFNDPAQIHGLLARFDLPLYVTTNYDDFMYLALQQRHKRPRHDHSVWYRTVTPGGHRSPLDDARYAPSALEPLVFHLHGCHQVPQSLVLTEDDYIEYLVQLASDTHRKAGRVSGLLPNYVYGELRSRPLLFIGYSLRDWTFLVLFRTLLHGIPDSHRRRHVSVQVDPKERKAREYVERYLGSQHIQIFWDSASKFARGLNNRIGDAGV